MTPARLAVFRTEMTKGEKVVTKQTDCYTLPHVPECGHGYLFLFLQSGLLGSYQLPSGTVFNLLS